MQRVWAKLFHSRNLDMENMPVHEGDDFSIKSQVGFHFPIVPGEEKEGGDSCEN